VQAWDVQRFAFRDGTIEDSAGACISVARSPDAVIVDSTFSRCGQEGIHATLADRLVVRGNRILDNNPSGAFDPEWEAGGAKVTRSTGVVFEDNDVANNRGPGIWCDIDCRQLHVRDNAWANDRAGIQVEISDGALVSATRRTDSRRECWGAGISMSSSREVGARERLRGMPTARRRQPAPWRCALPIAAIGRRNVVVARRARMGFALPGSRTDRADVRSGARRRLPMFLVRPPGEQRRPLRRAGSHAPDVPRTPWRQCAT
jgi:hypothetical protein